MEAAGFEDGFGEVLIGGVSRGQISLNCTPVSASQERESVAH